MLRSSARGSGGEAGLDRSWLDGGDVCARYDAFCALGEDARAAWLGWAVARTIHAVPAGRSGSHFLNHLGDKLEIDVAAWWRPTAKNYFDRITKPEQLMNTLPQVARVLTDPAEAAAVTATA